MRYIKRNRIHKNADFKRVISKRIVVKNDEFLIYCSRNTLNHVRVGISVFSKVKNAVKRNRIKRQVKAMLNSLIKKENDSIDIVIIVREKFLNNNFFLNFNSLNNLLGKLNV